MASSHQVLLLSLTLVIFGNAFASNVTSSAPQSGLYQAALEPLYTMTNGFLHTVFPSAGVNIETIASVIKQLNVSSPQPWPLTQEVLRGYIGFATCIVIGLLLIVLMPFIGLFCCCCRLCNQCGGRTHEMDPPNAKCKRLVCGGLLMVFVVIMLGGTVMIFFSASQLNSIQQDNTLRDQVNSRSQQLTSTVQETINQDLLGQAAKAVDTMEAEIDDAIDTVPSVLSEIIQSVANGGDIENAIQNISRDIKTLNSSISSTISNIETYEDNRKLAAAKASDASNKAQALACVKSNCQALKTAANNFNQLINGFTLSQAIKDVEDLRSNFDRVDEASGLYNTTLTEVQKRINDSIPTARSEIQSLVSQAKAELTKITNSTSGTVEPFLDSISVSSAQAVDYLNDPTAGQVFLYQYYSTMALGGIVAFIVLLFLLGLACGCGSRPGQGSCCNRGTGANCLLAAVGFTFIFFSLLMLITWVSFAVGSLTTSHVCWAVQDPSTLRKELQKNPIVIPFNAQSINIGDFVGIYDGCLKDESFGDALEKLKTLVPEQFSREKVLELIQGQLGNANLEQAIDTINVDPSSLIFLKPELSAALTGLGNLDFNQFNLTDLRNAVNTETSPLLNSLIQLTTAAQTDADPAEQSTLADIKALYELIRDDYQVKMTAAAAALDPDIETILRTTALQTSALALHDVLNTTQEELTKNGADTIKQALTDLATQIVGTANMTAVNAVNDIFGTKCSKLASSMRDLFNIACDTVLNPFNGLWFSLGWSLGMALLSIIVALFVVSLYRRERPFDEEDKEGDL